MFGIVSEDKYRELEYRVANQRYVIALLSIRLGLATEEGVLAQGYENFADQLVRHQLLLDDADRMKRDLENARNFMKIEGN